MDVTRKLIRSSFLSNQYTKWHELSWTTLCNVLLTIKFELKRGHDFTILKYVWTNFYSQIIYNVSRLEQTHFISYKACQKVTGIPHTENKSTASIIPRHSNNLLMYLSYRCENVWKENDGGTDNNPKPDLDNINGQITILKQILIISMHIASLVKRPCYLLKLSSRNENMDVPRADNSVKNWQNLPISNSKPDLLTVNTYSKFC